MGKRESRFYPLWFLVRVMLGIIFIYSGLGKLLSPLAETRALFYEYTLLPDFAVPWVALLFPWVEFFVGSFLILGYLTRWMAAAVMGFTFCFVALLGSEFLIKGHFPLDCGCFAGSWKLPTLAIFFMDIINFLLTLQLVRIKEHRWSLDQWMTAKFGCRRPWEFRVMAMGAILTVCLAVFAVALRSMAPLDSGDLLVPVEEPVSHPAQAEAPGAPAKPAVSLTELPKTLTPRLLEQKRLPEPAVKPAAGLSEFPKSPAVSSAAQKLPLKQMGNLAAPVEILEYTDFQCPACRGAKPIIAGIMGKYPGQVRLIFKHYPLPGHIWAKPAHRAAECAHAQGRFWPYYNLLYDNQQAWAGEKSSEVFINFAGDLSLDVARFQGCLNSSEPDVGVEADIAEAKKKGIRATPTFFINGERVVGSRDLQLKSGEIIERVLTKYIKE